MWNLSLLRSVWVSERTIWNLEVKYNLHALETWWVGFFICIHFVQEMWLIFKPTYHSAVWRMWRCSFTSLYSIAPLYKTQTGLEYIVINYWLKYHPLCAIMEADALLWDVWIKWERHTDNLRICREQIINLCTASSYQNLKLMSPTTE